MILGGFTSRTDTDDFLSDKFRNLTKFANKVPFMTGMNSTESGCMFLLFSEFATPGLKDGWTEEKMIEHYKKQAQETGQNPEKIPDFIQELKKAYSTGRDMTGKMEYSRLHALYQGDWVR